MSGGLESIKYVAHAIIPKSLRIILRAVAEIGFVCVDRINGIKLIFFWQLSKKKTIDMLNYRDLQGARRWLGGKAYREMTNELFKLNIERISKKGRIEIWLMLFLDSAWSCDYLYRLFERTEEIDPIVVLMDILDNETNARNRRFVEGKRYKYISLKDIEQGQEVPDLVMYPTLYDQYIKGIDIGNRKLGSLLLCIPYTFWWDLGTNSLLENDNASMLWRFYAPTKIHMQMGIERNIIGDQIMRYSGYPKLDSLFNCDCNSFRDGRKEVIYAPGYFSSQESKNYSTFNINAFEILQLAKSTEHILNWVYRPHPQLGESLANSGIMTLTDYRAYEAEWSKLTNVQMSLGGPYQDIFLSSDAMITDAISFVSTYQYVKKPLLFIDRQCGEGLNEFGRKLHNVVYHAAAKDIDTIKRFIEDVVIGKNDVLKEKRDQFFREYLDYYSENHCSASEYIYNDICKAILGGE